MAIKIEVPSKQFNGERGGIDFVNGVAIVEDEAKGRAIANQLGYKVIEEEKPKAKPASRKKAASKGDEK